MKELDEFLTQGVGVHPPMWVGISSLMNTYQENRGLSDTKSFCRGSFAPS